MTSGRALDAARSGDAVRYALVTAGINPDRWQDGRGSRLDAHERQLYVWLLRCFAGGERPGKASIQAQAARLQLDPLATLTKLASEDLLRLDASGDVQHAYPFSVLPTVHQVWLGDEPAPVHAMCAIDALGMASMVGRPAKVVSRDPMSADEIRAWINPDGTVRWEPESAVVLLGSEQGRGCIADACCRVINFFVSQAQAERHLRDRPALTGTLLTVPQGVEAGRIIFGGLLQN